jgi:hypothetical protein
MITFFEVLGMTCSLVTMVMTNFGDDNDYIYVGSNIYNGNGGPGADFCNDVEIVRNCEEAENK